MRAGFVPEGFTPPPGLVIDGFVLEPLGTEHNERDHAAWMSSIEHIHDTPGFGADDPDPWPTPMSLEQNLEDLRVHAREWQERSGFTYTVLDAPDGDVIGCVYIYPSAHDGVDAKVRSWVRVSHASLDGPLRQAVRHWLDGPQWPFEHIDDATG